MQHMDEPQTCTECEYDLTGLDRNGCLVLCPECGAENRIGKIEFDLLHPPLPAWWAITLRLGWPTALAGLMAYVAWRIGDPGFTRGIWNLTLIALAIGAGRGLMLGLDCSRPRRRSGPIFAAIVWGLGGGIVLAGVVFLLTWFAAWFGGEIIIAL